MRHINMKKEEYIYDHANLYVEEHDGTMVMSVERKR